MIVQLNKEAVDKLFEDMTTDDTDIVVSIFKMVLPRWNEVESLGQYITANKTTNNYIMKKFINRTFKKNVAGKRILAGGTWMNYGFSQINTEHLKDWEVEYDESLITYK
jgi:hypothetical protein